MAKELLCRHCHKRILADYSGAKCPSCGAQLNSRTIIRPFSEHNRRFPTSSRRKAWAALAVIMAGIVLALSLMAYSAFCGSARVVAGVIGLMNLAFILAFITRKILSAAAQKGRSLAAKIALVSTLILMLVSIALLIAEDVSVPCSVALLSFPAIILLSAIYVVISRPHKGTGSLGDLALTYVVLMFAVIWLWAYRSFQYSHHTPYDYGPLRGFGLVALILGGFVLASFAIFRAWKDPHARKRGVAALILVLAQTPVACFIVYDNLTWKYPSWVETRIYGDVRNISTAIRLFHEDTGVWSIQPPPGHPPESRVDFLYGNMGDMPGFTKEAWSSWGSRSEDMYFILVTNGRNRPLCRYGLDIPDNPTWKRKPPGGWAGPYLPYVTDDPWGFAYLISVSGFEGGTRPDNHVWCLSAGPDNIVDTPAWATETQGDDIAYRTE